MSNYYPGTSWWVSTPLCCSTFPAFAVIYILLQHWCSSACFLLWQRVDVPLVSQRTGDISARVFCWSSSLAMYHGQIYKIASSSICSDVCLLFHLSLCSSSASCLLIISRGFQGVACHLYRCLFLWCCLRTGVSECVADMF